MLQKQRVVESPGSGPAAGFTLLEVLLAMAVLSVGLLGIAGMQISSIQGNVTSRDLSVAVHLAQDRCEKLMEAPFFADNDFTDNDADGEVDEAGEPSTDLAAGLTHQAVDGKYTVSWAVVDDAPLPAISSITVCKTITVTVSWAERGAQRSTAVAIVKTNL